MRNNPPRPAVLCILTLNRHQALYSGIIFHQGLVSDPNICKKDQLYVYMKSYEVIKTARHRTSVKI